MLLLLLAEKAIPQMARKSKLRGWDCQAACFERPVAAIFEKNDCSTSASGVPLTKENRRRFKTAPF